MIVSTLSNAVTSINCNSQGISDLTGIEDFDIPSNFCDLLTVINSPALDVSNNTALTYLNCYIIN